MKYKVLSEYSSAEIVNAITTAISMGWNPMGNPSVDASAHRWICIMWKNE